MKTALIILNYNNADDTRACLESILEHNTAPVKFIVVDNASRIDDLESVRKDMTRLFGKDFAYYDESAKAPTVLPEAVLVPTGANMGYARGNNVGLALAYTDPEIDNVMILNNDIIFVEDIIASLIEKRDTLADCAIISPVLYKKGMGEYDYNCARRCIEVKSLIKENFLHYLYVMMHKKNTGISEDIYILMDKHPEGGTLEIQLPSGSCMLTDKEMFHDLGFFDPNTFMYSEENILYKKIQKTGKKNYLSLDDKCIHLGAATTTNLPNNKWLVRHAKNSEIYYVKQYSGASSLTKAIHKISVEFYMMTYTLQKLLKRK